jgi:hypothetical protein
LHFRDGTAHHGDASEQLNPEMAQSCVSARSLSGERKSQSYFVRTQARRYEFSAELIGGLTQSFVRKDNQLLFVILGMLNHSLESPAPFSSQQIRSNAAPCPQQRLIEPTFMAIRPFGIGGRGGEVTSISE